MLVDVYPKLEEVKKAVEGRKKEVRLFPVYAYVCGHELTPSMAYLKLSGSWEGTRKASFLLESATSTAKLDRFSYIGIEPRKVIRTGKHGSGEEDPLVVLERELKAFGVAEPRPDLPPLSGGAIGYISYDCVRYFEPKVARDQTDSLQLPESVMMLCETLVAFDHVYQRVQVIHNIVLEADVDLDEAYAAASAKIADIVSVLESERLPRPRQVPIRLNREFTSSTDQAKYEGYVKALKDHILKGSIIQAVPSRRISRPTDLHPFNIYRQLRMMNPSPYMFYLDFLDFQVIGASPEMLCSVDTNRRVVTHPIAGTVKRGSTPEEDLTLLNSLKNSLKDRAEHIMLVDLARNDINRICDPMTTTVDRLSSVQQFSHVQHLVSEVSGTLRKDKDRFDAFRSIFPAGTVSGAPKVRAMELIAELEGEKRGVYAGAVGFCPFDGTSMEMCIALRTMVYKDNVVYLQAGGGIVFDSDPYEEYIETVNKLMANRASIVEAERVLSQRVGTADEAPQK